MRFGNLQALHFLWLFAGLVLFLIFSEKRRLRFMEKFAGSELIEQLTPSLDRRKRMLKSIMIALAFLFMCLALVRPQWGFEWKEVKRSGLDIMIAIDTSKSMLAEDVRPNRLERTKLAVKDLVRNLNGDRIGLTAFAGSAFVQCPMTVDYNGFLLALDDLDVYTIPQGGTSISSAIKQGLKILSKGRRKYKVMIIITDGEDHEGKAAEWAEKAKKQGIKIFTIGIGTREGDLIPVTDESGSRIFLKDRNGNVVKTRLDEDTLKQIALTTGGSYVKSTSTEFGLELLYREKLSKMEKREIKNRMVRKYFERFQWPLVIALMLLCAEFMIRDARIKE